ncbi:CPBP family intramembrane glutamic endopeptidase [Thermosediminibacter litoriperuensis]|uniref:CAAX prenyl protease-like protein n=1 Tax=Thermosediminibacter litoriperuensis TaxID=291989 RepID=A0A5S5AXX2_9FIRM|nr:CPBP family intramembrane glutamic endopeptidase [Thermosediminibacter litoriperuensis]TYP57680.1 CAAX prenyl protease-like protein [Thermosediminibacter litoriperuensis]
MNNISSLLDGKVLNIMLHFYRRLKETPLLLGCIIVGLAVTFGLQGFQGLFIGLINLFLLLIWALIIRIMTEDSPEQVKLKNPKLELSIGVILVIYNIIMAIFVHLNGEYIFNNKLHISIYRFLQNSFLFNDLGYMELIKLCVSIINAGLNTIIITLPFLLVFKLMGYKYKEIGFRGGYWELTIVLLGLSLLLGIYEGLYKEIDYKLLVFSYIIRIFINGLPEELFYRGFLLPRLEVILKNSLNALVISSIIFSAVHVPSWVIKYNHSLWHAFLDIFSFGYQSHSLILGYLYLRTRSVIPGILWHASVGILGKIFL